MGIFYRVYLKEPFPLNKRMQLLLEIAKEREIVDQDQNSICFEPFKIHIPSTNFIIEEKSKEYSTPFDWHFEINIFNSYKNWFRALVGFVDALIDAYGNDFILEANGDFCVLKYVDKKVLINSVIKKQFPFNELNKSIEYFENPKPNNIEIAEVVRLLKRLMVELNKHEAAIQYEPIGEKQIIFSFDGWLISFSYDEEGLDYVENVIDPNGRSTHCDYWYESNERKNPLEYLSHEEINFLSLAFTVK